MSFVHLPIPPILTAVQIAADVHSGPRELKRVFNHHIATLDKNPNAPDTEFGIMALLLPINVGL